MSVVKINALTIPEGSGPELEARFAARAHKVDQRPGFEGFQLLRPVDGESRYFVMTTWASEDDFQAWRQSRTPREESMILDAELLEFEVVEFPE